MKRIIYTAIVLSVFCFSSCESFLTEKQYDFIGPELVGESEDAKEYWLNGIYHTFNGEKYFQYGGFTKMWEMDNDDISGPDWAMSAVGAGSFQGFWAADYIWDGPYQVIHRANTALGKVEAMSLSENSKKDAIGQIYFLRAFAYFQLVRAYGGVPIHTEPVSEGSKPHQPRATVEETFNRIIDDLKQAEKMMYSNKDKAYKIGRPGRGAASLLLSKVYLAMASASAPAGTTVTVLGGPAVKKRERKYGKNRKAHRTDPFQNRRTGI